MSSARIGRPPASVVVWSMAHWLISLRSRGDQVSNTQPAPPPIALPSTPAQLVEIQLMQDHGICGDQFLTFQPIDRKHWRLGEVEFRELCCQCVEPPHSTRVIVLVMADQEFFRKTFDVLRVEGERLDLITHWFGSCIGCGLCCSGYLNDGRGDRYTGHQTSALREGAPLHFLLHVCPQW